MNRAVLIVTLFAACAPSFEKASKDAERHNASESARVEDQIKAIRARFGAAVFEPPAEQRPESPAGLIKHPRDPRVTLLVENGRVGYITTIGYCGTAPVYPTAIFATTATGVTIVLVDLVASVSDTHVKGSCGAGGCGAPPPPPQTNIQWMPVADPGAVVIDRRTITYTQETVSCDHPIYPP